MRLSRHRWFLHGPVRRTTGAQLEGAAGEATAQGPVRDVARCRGDGPWRLLLPGTGRVKSRAPMAANPAGGARSPLGRRPRVLINCSNLHVGGAVAVASSFIHCLSQDPPQDLSVCLLLSTAVHNNLAAMRSDLGGFADCRVVDHHGFRSLWRGLHEHFAHHDVVFTVFGPAYTLSRKPLHVCGFAQPLIVYPRNPIERRMSTVARWSQRLKYLVQEWFFARADELVVELEHVQAALARKSIFRGVPIHIVYNTVDSVFLDPPRWQPVALPAASTGLKLGVVSRNYVHKNLHCLPALKERLLRVHGLAVDFYVTFTDAEWQACAPSYRDAVYNAGALVLAQSPSFYAAMDGVIFPSLLECFSAVPLEAMCMRRPLFASDLPFIRDCCHEHAIYFDPLSVESIARAIAAYFLLEQSERVRRLDAAFAFLGRYPGPGERASAYLEIVRGALARHDSAMPSPRTASP
ncbi:MAG: glycosyltransferase family 4 protein [Burkholderiaceae bacterium]|nr:glycosyltransferase family 4 protein [Burkholderiaceae bacterium]